VTLAPELRADLEASGAESREVAGGGGVLHALDFGGSGPDVLLIPGITSPAITWEFVARELLPELRIVVADLRGRGLSTPAADGRYDIDAYADDAAALIEGLALERPIVLGHSLGARVGAAVAARPDVATGPALLVDPPLTGPGRAPYPMPAAAFRDQLREAYAGTTADAVARHWPRWPRRELELRARWLRTCEEHAVLESHRQFEREDFLPLWREVPAPVALMRGGDSPVVTEEGARELAEARPDAPILVVPGAGHMIPWDELGGFLRATREFLGSVREGARA
jgi:N-formylmaleamate deformylase